MRWERRRRFAIIVAALIILSMVLTLIIATAAKAESTAPPGVKSNITHLVLSLKDSKLSIVQMMDIANSGTADSPSLAIPLPAGATDFGDMTGNTALKDGNVTVAAIPAGANKQVGFHYTLPANGSATLTIQDSPPADDMFVLIDEATLSLDPALVGKGFTDLDLVVLGQSAYRQFSVTRTTPGTPLVITVKAGGNPDAAAKAVAAAASQASAGAAGSTAQGSSAGQSSTAAATQDSGKGVGIGILFGVILLAVAFVVARALRKRSPKVQAAATVETAPRTLEELQQERERLTEKIAVLDEEALIEPSPDLEKQRALYKHRLAAVQRMLRDLESQAE